LATSEAHPRQRREGRNGGDAETATRKGKASKGVAPSGKVRWKRRTKSTKRAISPTMRSDADAGWKHGEPHGRLRGAIDSRGTLWRKPSESCETARAEHTSVLVDRRRRSGFGQAGSGCSVLENGGGAFFDESQERSSKAFDSARNRRLESSANWESLRERRSQRQVVIR